MAKWTGGEGWSFRPADASKSRHEESLPPLPAAEHRLRVSLEKRAQGKVMTIVAPLRLPALERKELAKALKTACGTGGTSTDDSVELQGDCRERALKWLRDHGWGLR